MNYSFTDRVRRVLARARDRAVQLRQEPLRPEHLLLGLLGEDGGVSNSVLEALGVDRSELAREVEAAAGPPDARFRGTGEIRYGRTAKRVLEKAVAQARQLGHSYVGTEHVLLGLLALGRDAPRALVEHVTLEDAQAETLRLLPGQGVGVRVERERGGAFRVVIDDASSASIYEQIVAQVQEAVATRRLRPGARLPTVRRLADELDIAPGTVARAYSELERLGVVETAGARGTRVADAPAAGAGDGDAELEGLLRPVAVAAFHLGASAGDLRSALERAMEGIFKG
jgi:DNA-binding transcriptional regulator YhcF (GntR family)